jgi:hypothetical protein
MRIPRTAVATFAVLVIGGWVLMAHSQARQEDYEKKVEEAQVPKAALSTLKALAGAAPIEEFAEEVEDGRKFYEGTWAGPHGHVDGLVTEAGALVEIEEAVPADAVPAAARAEVEKEAGTGATLAFEKKTLLMYEAHFKKDGKGREIIVLPDGRRYFEEGDEQGEDEDEGR